MCLKTELNKQHKCHQLHKLRGNQLCVLDFSALHLFNRTNKITHFAVLKIKKIIYCCNFPFISFEMIHLLCKAVVFGT